MRMWEVGGDTWVDSEPVWSMMWPVNVLWRIMFVAGITTARETLFFQKQQWQRLKMVTLMLLYYRYHQSCRVFKFKKLYFSPVKRIPVATFWFLSSQSPDRCTIWTGQNPAARWRLKGWSHEPNVASTVSTRTNRAKVGTTHPGYPLIHKLMNCS